MINLTIECVSTESGVMYHGNMLINVFNIKNPDAIAKELSDQIDPGLLVTKSNQDLFLDQISTEHLRKYLRDRES